jgi:hypothetical protein
LIFVISGFSATATNLNNPPNAPEITGPATGKPNTYYDFNFIATDPEGDDIYYNVSWGCCAGETHTYGPYPSGEIMTLEHAWSEQGSFTITAKANDVFDMEGPEGTFNINIPRDKNPCSYIFMILQSRFQITFQILQIIF